MITRVSRAWRALVIVCASALLATCGGDDDSGMFYMVGAAKRAITPSDATAPPGGQVFLGGYGLGPVRPSTGVLPPPIMVRAFVIANGTDAVAFAQNETQGAFAAYKTGPYGATDIAAEVEAATGGRIPRTHVIVGSDHSHAGPDTTGVWGGLPDPYLQYIKDQTVGAITDALAAARPARLVHGAANASDLIRSQFQDPPNDEVDGELRVLAALDPESSDVQAILINFAAHATVMGSGNTLISADWPGVTATQAEEMLGVNTAVVMVADVGRTQPRREDVPGETDPQRLTGYASAVTVRVFEAVSNIIPATSSGIEAVQLYLREPFINAFFSADALGALVSRRDDAPWRVGNDIGTLVSGVRVGDLFFAGVPGEGYPAIQFALEERVPAAQHFIFGLANDQLGYLIAPEEGYDQVLAAAPDNDNAIFNVSPAIGDHVMCTAFKAARATGFTLPDDPERCQRWADEDNSLPF